MRGETTSGLILRTGAVALVVSLIANLALFVIVGLIGIDLVQGDPAGGDELVPITAVNVIFASIVGGVVGTALALLVGRFVGRARTVFIVIGAIGFIVSMGGPFTIPDSPTDNLVVLTIMHVVAAVIIVGLLARVLPDGRAPSS